MCLPFGMMIASRVLRIMKMSSSASKDFATSSSLSVNLVALPSAANLSRSCRSGSVTATIHRAASAASLNQSRSFWLGWPFLAARPQSRRLLKFLFPLTWYVIGHARLTLMKIDRQDFAPMPHIEMAQAWQPT